MALALILHAGAGSPSEVPKDPKITRVLVEALDAGWSALLQDDSSELAVLNVLRILEASPYFDAGYGSYPNEFGRVYQDVALMRGSGQFAAVMNIPRLKFPSQFAADTLNSRSSSITLAWSDERMKEIEQLPEQDRERYGLVLKHEELIAEIALRATEQYREAVFNSSKSEKKNKIKIGGTVGCVARDAGGRIFAGTSTGGTPLKPHSRVGDSAVIGAGTYADDSICGLSATGEGEAFLSSLVSGHVIARARIAMEKQADIFSLKPEKLSLIILEELVRMEEKNGGQGGMIVLPRIGPPLYAFNSKIMHVALRYIIKDYSLSECGYSQGESTDQGTLREEYGIMLNSSLL